MKAVVDAFNQEKALVGAFSVITNLRMELLQALISRLNVTLVLTITGGVLSLVLDLGFALCHRAKNGGAWNWDGTVLHMKSEESKEEIPGPEEAQVDTQLQSLSTAV